MLSKNREWTEKNHKEIESLAYFKWVDSGRPIGQDKYFWDLAEQEIWEKEHVEVIEITYPAKKKTIWGFEYTWGYDDDDDYNGISYISTRG